MLKQVQHDDEMQTNGGGSGDPRNMRARGLETPGDQVINKFTVPTGPMAGTAPGHYIYGKEIAYAAFLRTLGSEPCNAL
jgi:hypothetical protein